MNPALGSYILREKIADGGMGEVFRATKKGTLGFEKSFVLKRLLPFYSDEKEFISMITHEARLSSELNHPNIVQTVDFLNLNGNYCLIMEYVPGRDLGQIIRKLKGDGRSIPPYLALYIVGELLKALKYAHLFNKDDTLKGIIHRDISPQNILISYSGIVKLTDFGIAHSSYNDIKTKTGELKGKANYMSPEQIRCEKIDSRSDLFSLAAVLYEILYLRKPFESSNEFETMQSIANSPDSPLYPDDDSLPRQIKSLLEKGLKKNRDDRFASASVFLSEVLDTIPKEKLKIAQENLRNLMMDLFPKEQRQTIPVEKTPLLKKESINTVVSSQSLIFTGSTGHKPKFKQLPRPFLMFILLGILALLSSKYVFKLQSKTLQNTPKADTEIVNGQEKSKEDKILRAKAIASRIQSVEINSHPWSKIYINGKFMGETPKRDIKLEPGEYLLNLSFATGQNIIKKFKVENGKKIIIFEKLEKK